MKEDSRSSIGLATESKTAESAPWEPKHLRALMAQLCGPLRTDGAPEYFTRPDYPEVNTVAYSSPKQTFYSLVRTADGKHRLRFGSLESRGGASMDGDHMVVSNDPADTGDALEAVGPIHSLIPNASGTRLLLTGPTFVGIVDIQSGPKFVLSRVLEQPGQLVRKAAWHPLAQNTVVVLRDRPTLEFWNVTKMAPPQVIHLASRQRGESLVMSFCFGPPRLWQHFTIYLLCDEKNHGLEIKALCPVIPEGARVEATAMLQLQDQVATLLAFAQRDRERARQGAGQIAQKEELKEQLVMCFGNMRERLEGKADDRRYLQNGWVESRRSLIHRDNRPVAIQTVSLSEKVLGRKWYSPRCMVNDMKLVSPSSLSEVAMIAVSWCIGTEVEVEDHSYLDIYALLGDIQPKFYDRGAPSDLDPVERLTRGLEAYPLSFFCLGKHDPRTPHFPPRVFKDDYRPGVLYIIYAGKLMVAQVGGIPGLIEAVQGPWQERRFDPKLFSKDLSDNELVIKEVFDTQRVVGAAIVADVVFGHVLVCREEKEIAARAINLSLIPYMDKSRRARDTEERKAIKPSMPQLAIEAEQRGYKPLEDHIKRLEKSLEDGMSSLSARQLNAAQQDEILLQEQEEVTYRLVLPARELLNRAMYREKDLLEVYKTQKTKADVLLKALEDKEKAWKELEEKSRKVKEKNENISEMSLQSLSLLRLMQRRLSPQEKRDLARLAQYEAQCENLEKKLQVIRKHMEKAPPSGPDADDEIKELERLAEKQWQGVQRVKDYIRSIARQHMSYGDQEGERSSGRRFDMDDIRRALPEPDWDRPTVHYMRDED